MLQAEYNSEIIKNREADVKCRDLRKEDRDMDSYSIGKASGIAFGIIVGLLICVIVFRYVNRDKKLKTHYDERQEAVRGRAYMYGFWGCVIGAAIVICIDTAGIVFANRLTMDFLVIFIGILVQVTYSIWNDGYYGLNTNRKRFYAICIIAGLVNLLVVIANIVNGTFIENMVLSDSAVNLLIVILFLIVAAELIIKDRLDAGASDNNDKDDNED